MKITLILFCAGWILVSDKIGCKNNSSLSPIEEIKSSKSLEFSTILTTITYQEKKIKIILQLTFSDMFHLETRRKQIPGIIR